MTKKAALIRAILDQHDYEAALRWLEVRIVAGILGREGFLTTYEVTALEIANEIARRAGTLPVVHRHDLVLSSAPCSEPTGSQ